MTPLPDRSAREQALDPAASFIVQAPAGSGKTGLLIQRYLRLLGCVDEPEEVLAATFTLKAAGEMRDRVIRALHDAASGREPKDAHEALTIALARRLLDDPVRREWSLDQHPARMRIRTLDSVNSWIAGLAPLSAGQGALRRVSDRPELAYDEAAEATLALAGEEQEYAAPVVELLRHLDNQSDRLCRLLVAMLPKRDQWLRRLPSGPSARSRMEGVLEQYIGLRLGTAESALPAGTLGELLSLMPYAAVRLQEAGDGNALADWLGVAAWPASVADRARLWRGIVATLLTADGDWRTRLDKRNGFPADGREEKRRVGELIARCASCPALNEVLQEIGALPPARFTDAQWAALEAMGRALRLAAGQLELVFSRRGIVDFQGVAAAALDVLGTAEEPSEIGLALDYRIRHILVDEFQDTSIAQFDLLRRLTAGWSDGDGRTMFLVGDPMQSIYRFREAEVSLFQQVRDEGLGDLRPAFLRLSANFRSRPAIVDWVNSTFADLFPATPDLALGGVPYAPCEAVAADLADSGVQCHWQHAEDADSEARAVATIVASARAERPGESICILVRSRRHAPPLMQALQAEGIPFVAPEIAEVAHVSAVQDVLALARALLNPADRLAWIGLLRTPFVGLPLDVITTLTAHDHESAVPDLLRAVQGDRVGADSASRVARLLGVMGDAARTIGRRPLRDVVEGAWLALGGAETLARDDEREAVTHLLDEIEADDDGGDCRDLLALAERLDRSHASAGSGKPGVTLMTMHKAKGLEFDTVILPSLERGTRGQQQPLLVWQEVPLQAQEPALVLAPCPAADQDGDPHFRWLSRLIGVRQDYENLRLLYVAATRAKRRLHLLARLRPARSGSAEDRQLDHPARGSLLGYLWPVIGGEAAQAFRDMPWRPPGDRSTPVWIEPLWRRLPAEWAPATLPAPLPAPPEAAPGEGARPEFEWAGDEARHVGTLVHGWLQRMAQQGRIIAPDPAAVSEDTRRRLRPLGVSGDAAARIAARVLANLQAVHEDPQADWLLAVPHAESACELDLTRWDGREFRRLKVDRTFVTAEGERWIVDYKTARHEGGSLDAFLDAEIERHRSQLLGYRDAFRAMEDRPTRLALYFPQLKVLRELRE